MDGSLPRKASFAALAALLLAAWAAPSGAASFASASVGPISYQLIDLNPDDGIAPSITFLMPDQFNGGPGLSFAYTETEDTGTGLMDARSNTGFGWAPLSANASVPGSWASAAISGNGTPLGSTVSATGASYGTAGGSEDYGKYFANMTTDAGFTLSPYTEVVFRAGVSLSASVTYGTYNDVWEEANAWGTFFVWPDDEVNIGSRMVRAVPSYWDQDPIDNVSFNGILTVSLANNSADELDGYFGSYAHAWGNSTAPVPEPETWALLLAGLGIMGGVARRRRKRQA
ncbi:MAG TPA: PEPxxWA-CTERM sorting domain-containing protein [Candidatus Desulfobacillus sp.]|nr:PEPxxWA-CTERM sorting domain-containing protein [Candidatus Desulfobacillus sp.]